MELEGEESEERLGEVEQPQAAEPKPSITRDRSRIVIKTLSRFGWEYEVNYALITSEGDPTSYKEAINVNDKDSWICAMADEMKALRKNSVWELVPRPKDRSIASCKWVFWKKETVSKDETPRYKARLVMNGFSQKEGIDYDEIFSLMVRHTSILVLLAMVAQFDMKLE